MNALLALDADTADDTLAHARPWVEPLATRLDLVHVAIPPELAGASPELQAAIDAGAARNEAVLRGRLEALLASLPAERRGRVIVSRARHVADELSARGGAYDLLMVGTHGRQGLARWWLGSVAERVVRTSPVPVLVLRGSPGGRGVLVALDLSGDADGLIRAASRWASRLDARLDLVHVTPPPLPIDGVTDAGGGWALGWLEASRAAEARLAELLQEVPEPIRGTVQSERGDPARVVAEHANRYGLVVVGTHQRRGAERFWLGSVAERVTRRAEAAVLVVPSAIHPAA